MRSRPSLFLCAGLMALALAACAKSSPSLGEAGLGETAAATGFVPDRLKAQSCPDGAPFLAPTPISISAAPVPLSPVDTPDGLPEGISFHAGWSLVSTNENFGGLSGMEILADDTFLFVSDAGAFVWLGQDGVGAPSGESAISYMMDASGQILQGKTDADAEGLALQDGLAFVSFERNHRIEAFDLETCGTNARAAHVAALPSQFNGAGVHENRGPEALALSDGLVAGYEERPGNGTTAFATLAPGESPPHLSFAPDAAAPYDGPLTGLSSPVDGVGYGVRRRYSPLSGNTITVEMMAGGAVGESPVALFKLARPLSVDNFEGIAAARLPDGRHRVWLIADNNFSDRQRTLLFAFDIEPTRFIPDATSDDTHLSPLQN